MEPIKTKRPWRAWAWILCSIWLASGLSHGDIIDDVEQLEKPKKKPKVYTDEDKTLETQPGPTLPPLNIPQTPVPDRPFPVPKSEPMPPQEKGAVTSTGKLDKEARRKLPVRFYSEGTSTYSQNGAVAQLDKNVVITQEDVRLQADQAKVKMAKGETNGVDSAEMIGKVSLARYSKDPAERITARGDRAIFDNAAQVVTLDGNARLWRDGHLIKGERIVYEIVTGMVKVDKVQGVVQPEKADK